MTSRLQVRDVLEQRTHEELTTELSVSIYDTARNDTAKKRREEIVSLLRACVCLISDGQFVGRNERGTRNLVIN